MKSLVSALLAGICIIAANSALARAPTVGVQDLGQDGDERYFSIRCSADRLLVLTQNKKKRPETACYLGKDEKEHCLTTTDIRDAGQKACEATE